jgi:hypothetical protein
VDLYLHSTNTPSWRGAQLGEHRDNFTFYLLLYVMSFRHSWFQIFSSAPCFGMFLVPVILWNPKQKVESHFVMCYVRLLLRYGHPKEQEIREKFVRSSYRDECLLEGR